MGFLSYLLNEKHFAYGNGEKIKIKKTNQISLGDTSNNSNIKIPAHFGTHIDFPFHFDNNSNFGGDYPADKFISDKVQLIVLDIDPIFDKLLGVQEMEKFNFDRETEILIVKTGINKYYNRDEYWKRNPGFSADLADYFKSLMPKLNIFGFDSISLTGRKYRSHGKIAHKKFLIENKILILEDMDLTHCGLKTQINKIIVSPLRFQESDGAPVTVFAEIYDKQYK